MCEGILSPAVVDSCASENAASPNKAVIKVVTKLTFVILMLFLFKHIDKNFGALA